METNQSAEEFYAKPAEDTLFEVETSVPEEEFVELDAINTRGSSVEIATLLRQKSRLIIKDTDVFPLAKLLTTRGEIVPAEVKLQQKENDFFYLELACEFDPAPGCRFHQAKFEVTLYNPDLPNDQQDLAPHSQAYDLVPRTVTKEIKFNRKFSFSPELKLEFGPFKAAAGLGKAEPSKDYIVYSTATEAFGFKERISGWSFSRSEYQEIARLHELFMVVRNPKGKSVAAKFTLSGELEAITKAGPFGPFPFSTTFRSKGETTDGVKRLC